MKSNVQQYHNNWIGFISGMAGGTGKFFLAINSESFTSRFLEAVLTAFICGVMGVVGKEFVVFIKKKYFKNKS